LFFCFIQNFVPNFLNKVGTVPIFREKGKVIKKMVEKNTEKNEERQIRKTNNAVIIGFLTICFGFLCKTSFIPSTAYTNLWFVFIIIGIIGIIFGLITSE